MSGPAYLRLALKIQHEQAILGPPNRRTDAKAVTRLSLHHVAVAAVHQMPAFVAGWLQLVHNSICFDILPSVDVGICAVFEQELLLRVGAVIAPGSSVSERNIS